ncbi:MAG TPA: hypothetical protein VK548_09815 [Candidatus Acidoferrum sp.]|nr:hypothetical protein [Candidatus Acidoferrum sp.]
MSEPLLLIVDHLDPAGIPSDRGPVTILPLGIVPSLYVAHLAEALTRASATVLPVEDVSERALEQLRGLYPAFLDEAVRQRIGAGPSLLTLLERDGTSAWWFTDACEKSPLRTPFLNRLYALLLVEGVLARRGFPRARLDLVDGSLAACLVSGLRARGLAVEEMTRRPARGRGLRTRLSGLRHFWLRFVAMRTAWGIQTLGNRLVLAMIGLRRPRPDSAVRSVVFSRYPVLYEAADSEVVRERNLEPVFPALRSRGPMWQVVLLTLWPWRLLRRRRNIRRAFDHGRIVPVLLFATVGELCSALAGADGLRWTWHYRRLRRRLSAHFAEWDVTPLWREELDRSFTGFELPTNLVLAAAMRRLMIAHRPSFVLHPCEFQPMERAIWHAASGTATRTVAFQHTTVSSNTLMFFFAKGEIERALAGHDRLDTPLPDYYLATGDWPLQIMRATGYPETRSEVVGAVRYNMLRVEAAPAREARASLDLPLERRILLVAGSSDRDDSLALLEALAGATADGAGEFVLLFKPHYHCPIAADVQRLFGGRPRHGWRLLGVDSDLHAHIRASDAVVLTNSTTGLEAIALGRPPVVFDNRAIVNIGPLVDMKDAALFAHSAAGLAEALEALLDPAVLARLRAAWPAALRRTFHVLDGRADDRLVGFLTARGLL